MSTSVLLFGSGWIGSQLVALLTSKNINVHIASARADDEAAIREEIKTHQPTHVVSCIGRTHGTVDGVHVNTIDYLEYPGKLLDNMRDNLFAPLLLAKLCDEHDIHYTYIGTGCIFEYDDEHPLGDVAHGFTEDSKPNFFGSSYSIVKGFTDQMMKWCPNALNVRIRMPITAESNPRDFISKIVAYEKICSMANSMTVLDELLPLLVDMMEHKRVGTVQLTNPGVISHEEILQMYKELIDPSKTWETMSYETQSTLLKSKRSNNCLDTTLLQSWYPEVKDIHTAVRDVLLRRAKK
jgi:dTDP-4-dehydrorhamnose reductase